MKSDYSPRFPRSISGNDFRLPLDHPEIEAVGRRADRLYRTAKLSDDERAWLLKKYAGLEVADLYLMGALGDRPLPKTDLRPCRPRLGGGTAGPTIEDHAGFVTRMLEYVERLERSNSGAAAIVDDIPTALDPAASERPVSVDDDRLGDPGDDI
ncbi:hypothetical protein NKH36_33150 [Mesorhizobium sp. M1312]|uniref:hypothetical protein n=1 Tax=unclassified Mesorhizobium TaxID=325217 RepID=UPI00333D3F84